MNEINKINLSEKTKFRLSGIIGIGNYFHQEINQRNFCNKKLSKYVTAFDYIDKIIIVLSVSSRGNCNTLCASVIGALVGIASATFAQFFFSSNRNNRNITLSIQETKRKSMIRFLCWLKVNSIALKL